MSTQDKIVMRMGLLWGPGLLVMNILAGVPITIDTVCALCFSAAILLMNRMGWLEV